MNKEIKGFLTNLKEQKIRRKKMQEKITYKQAIQRIQLIEIDVFKKSEIIATLFDKDKLETIQDIMKK